MLLDYLSSNALNKYPFSDKATLKAADSSYLTNDTFLDVVFVAKEKEIVGAFLSAYASNTGTSQFTLTFTYYNAAYATVGALTFNIPFASVIEKEFFGYGSSSAAVKVVFGPGFVNDKNVSVSKTFTITATPLERSAVVLMVPRVSALRFFNWNKFTNLVNASPLVSITSSEVSPAALTLQAGANTVFAQSKGLNYVDIVPGKGTGLYDACENGDLVIRSINDVGPDAHHAFSLFTDDCYTTTPVDNGLSLVNSCTPKCTPEQLDSFAHYTNRVIDGMQTVTDFANTINTHLKTQIQNFVTNILPTLNVPTYKVKFEKYNAVDTGLYYYSFSAAFFNNTTAAKTLDITFSSTGSIVASSRKHIIDNTTTVLTGNTFSVSVPCLKVCFLEFVVYGTPPKAATIAGTFGSVVVNSVNSLT